MESGFNMDQLKELFTICEIEHDWVDGKKDELLSFFSIYNEILSNLDTEEKVLKHSRQAHYSIIIELFEMTPVVYYNNESKDSAIKLSSSDSTVLNNFNKLYFSSAKKSVQENFNQIGLYEFNRWSNLAKDKFDYLSKAQSKEQLEDSLEQSLLSKHLIIDFLLKAKLNSIEKHFNLLFKPYLDSNEWLIDDKIVLLKKIIINIQDGLLQDRLFKPLDRMLLVGYRFQISKITSDKYLKRLILIYNKKLEGWGAEAVSIKISKGSSSYDNRIETDLSTDEIRSYFIKLNTKNKDLKDILSTEDIENLISSNFIGFSPKEKILLEPKIGLEAIRYFIYNFYSKIDERKYNNKQKKYCKLLIENFQKFKGKKIDVLTKKLSSPKPAYYPFD